MNSYKDTTLTPELFALRLKFSLKSSNYADMSCRKFSEVFNKRVSQCQITETMLHDWLQARSIPSEEKMIALSKLLGVSSDWLISGSE
jgi:transcriptional regulator with XRE-family HTH domain